MDTSLRRVRAEVTAARRKARHHRPIGHPSIRRALDLGVKNENENIASLCINFDCPDRRRMRNASRNRGRYTEPWEGIETNSIRIG